MHTKKVLGPFLFALKKGPSTFIFVRVKNKKERLALFCFLRFYDRCLLREYVLFLCRNNLLCDEEVVDRIGYLRTLANPGLYLVAIDYDGIGVGVVIPYHLNVIRALWCASRFGHNHTKFRMIRPANAL